MMEMDVDQRLLDELLEMLVISYQHSAQQQTFELVIEYPDRSEGSDREFLCITWEGVASITRSAGAHKAAQAFQAEFSCKASVPHVVLQAAEMSSGQELSVDLWLGVSFGGIEFRASTAKALRRGTSVVKVSDTQTAYFSLETGEALDFYAPFATT